MKKFLWPAIAGALVLAAVYGFTRGGDPALPREPATGQREWLRAQAQDKGDWTDLHIAALEGNLANAEKAVDEGARLDAQNEGTLWTPVDVAALYGRAEILRFLVNAWETQLKAPPDLDSLLLKAALHGHFEASRFLIEKGADVNKMTEDFEPLLRMVASHNHIAVLRLLLASGARVDAASAAGWTALHGAAERDGEGLRMLLDAGAKVDVPAGNGYTALHVAALHGQLRAAQGLLEHGAHAEARSVLGKTPLDLARERGHAQLAQWLAAFAPTPGGVLP